MIREQKTPLIFSRTILRLTQRFRQRGIQSTVTKTRRRLQKAEERLTLLDQETRHQLLLIKELQQLEAQQLHRVEEMTWRLSPELSGLPVTLPEPVEMSPLKERTLEKLEQATLQLRSKQE